MTEPSQPPHAPDASLPGPLRTRAIAVGVVAGLIMMMAALTVWEAGLPERMFGLAMAGASLVALLAAANGLRQWVAEARRTERAREELHRAESQLREADRLALPALWEVTHRRLDYYHRIATGQARRSFFNAQVAIAVGFGLLTGFAVAATRASTSTDSVVIGALGAVSAAFAGYISRTFVRSQETAAAHLRAYFDQPLEFSRFLAAERLLDSVDPDQRPAIVADLLRTVVAPGWPPRLADGASGAATITINTQPAPPTGSQPGRPADPSAAG